MCTSAALASRLAARMRCPLFLALLPAALGAGGWLPTQVGTWGAAPSLLPNPKLPDAPLLGNGALGVLEASDVLVVDPHSASFGHDNGVFLAKVAERSAAGVGEGGAEGSSAEADVPRTTI